MYLFCPKCHAQHPAAGRCPKCSSRLLSPGEAADTLAVSVAPPPEPIETTFAGRLGVGCVVALGLHLALHEWSVAALGSEEMSATEPVGFAVGFFLRLLTAVIGAALAGAGRRLNFSGGAAVGLVSGLAWLLVDGFPNIAFDPLRGGLVAVMVAIAGLVSLAAGQVWPEPVAVPDVPSPRGSSLLGLTPNAGKKKTGTPTRWAQIILATTMAVGGIVAADSVRAGLRGLPAGLVNLGGPAAVSRVDFQLSVLFVVVAAVISGVGTGAGFRHGVIAGILTGIGVIVARNTFEEGTLPGLDWLAEAATVPETPARTVEMTLAAFAFLAMSVGGWLGGQLCPPLRKKRKLRRERY